MNKVLVTLIAGMLASAAAAQGATDPSMTNKQKQEALRATTIEGSDRRPGVSRQQEANVKASKATEKMSADEKNKAFKDLNTKMVNPNSGGVDATAKMQKENTAASKEQARQKVNLNTPEAQKAMQKAATP